MKLIFSMSVALLCLSFSITKTKPFVPPGTVKINDTLFTDECEVSNFSWQEFEYWTKTNTVKTQKNI